MKRITVSDVTLKQGTTEKNANLSFKEKIEIAKLLDKVCVDFIDMGAIVNEKTDTLVLRTIANLLTNSALACCAGMSEESIEKTWEAVSGAKKARLIISLPVSDVQMEYILGKKQPKMLELAEKCIKKAVSFCPDVEFEAEDATRAEKAFLCKMIKTAVQAGAKTVTLDDSAGVMLPDEMKDFILELYREVPELQEVSLSVSCSDAINMAIANAFAATAVGAKGIKTSVLGDAAPAFENLINALNAKGDSLKYAFSVDKTAYRHTAEKIKKFTGTKEDSKLSVENNIEKHEETVLLDSNADISALILEVEKLGYDLSEDDKVKVYEAFKSAAAKKNIGAKELEAIVASTALQVPPTYRLKDYVINSGHSISASAHIILEKDGRTMQGISLGDGPIDAAFVAIGEIIGARYELDDFEVQSVTEGYEAIGEALVKLRNNGRLYSGRGISTDIIGASIKAYINALNKIVYEEEER